MVVITADMPGAYTGQPNTYYLTAGANRKTRLVVWTDADGVEHRIETADWWKLVNVTLWDAGVRQRRWPVGTEFSTYEGT